MKALKILAFLFCCALGVAAQARAGPNQSGTAAPIQAIQQASDPSAVVAAYANGIAVDPNDPKLHEAYITRMVDLGLPEMAYHQAQTLTTLESNNGLGWGVLAYVDARRGNMSDAISAITLGVQFAPENKFVEQTAGEVIAWYDLKADKSQLADNTKDAVAKIRGLVEQRTAFTESYAAAKKAYEGQSTSSTVVPSQYSSASQPQENPTVTAPLTSPAYYPADYGSSYDSEPYYYDSGPGWVQPAPWWWWWPVGFFGGCDFFPFGSVIVFNSFHHFHFHHFFDHGDHFKDFNHFDHRGFSQSAFWHRGGQSRTGFFGAPARPSASVVNRTQQIALNHSAGAQSAGMRWWNGVNGHNFVPGRTLPAATLGARQGTTVTRGATPMATTRSWNGISSGRPAPAFQTRSFAAPQGRVAASRSFSASRAFPRVGGRPTMPMRGAPFMGPSRSTFAGGGFHGGGRSFAARPSGGGFRGGGGGGSRGGGFGGGFHGGGRR